MDTFLTRYEKSSSVNVCNASGFPLVSAPALFVLPYRAVIGSGAIDPRLEISTGAVYLWVDIAPSQLIGNRLYS